MNDFRKLILRKVLLYSTVLEIFRQSEFHLYIGHILVSEFKKILRCTDFPSSLLKLLFLRLFHNSFHFVVGFQPFLARIYYTFGCLLSFLAKHTDNYDCIRVDSVYDSPSGINIIDSQFMAPSANRWQRSRVRKAKLLTKLKLSQQEACFKAGCLRKGWSSNFAFKPGERLVFYGHHLYNMSNVTYCQVQ
jgi:hypothetical protein